MITRNIKLALALITVLFSMDGCKVSQIVPAEGIYLHPGDKIISYQKLDSEEHIAILSEDYRFAGAYIYLDTLLIKTVSGTGSNKKTRQERLLLSDIKSFEMKRYRVDEMNGLDPVWIRTRANIIYAEGESVLAQSNVSINFERIFLAERPVHFSLKAGIGYFQKIRTRKDWAWTWETYSGPVYKLCSYLILKSGFEAGLGVSVMRCNNCQYLYEEPWKSDRRVYPIVSIGWRTQNRPLFLKTHMGTWGWGLSLGFTF